MPQNIPSNQFPHSYHKSEMEASKGLNTWSVMMSELAQGRELAKQLQNHLDPSTSPETRKYLIEKILFTYNKLLDQMAKHPSNNSFPIMAPNSQISFHGGTSSESPPSASHCSDPENHRRASKRRKTLPKWVKTVKVGTEEGGGIEGSLYDGYNWRKYGQKIILGAAFPRGYYRCTHRNTRGCYATKQVQKSTEDSTVFQVIYKGHHTCSQPSHISPPSTTPVPHGPKPEPAQSGPQQETQARFQQTPIVVQTQLKVETERSDIVDNDNIFCGIFPLPSTFVETVGGGALSQQFVSASLMTSDSNHLRSLPVCDVAGNGIQTPDSDVNEHGASGSDSTSFTLDFTWDELIIDPDFAFDEHSFFDNFTRM